MSKDFIKKRKLVSNNSILRSCPPNKIFHYLHNRDNKCMHQLKSINIENEKLDLSKERGSCGLFCSCSVPVHVSSHARHSLFIGVISGD